MPARRSADLVLPGAAYAEKHGTYVNLEGRVQRGERAVFPPGDAREDWAILRAVSELAGKKLPFDSFDQLRKRMVREHPELGRDGLIDLPWAPPKLDAKAAGPVRYPIADFYLTNAITPRQPDHAPLLGGIAPRRPDRGGGGMTAWFQTWGATYEWSWFIATVIGILVIALPLMLAVAMIIYAERKIWAAIALRRGPNVVGPWGLLQSFADGLKVFLKETIIPTSANQGLFLLAPIITFTVALIVWAVVPFAPGVVLTDINVGLLYILAASSLGVYGVIIAGWASNSKYPFYSALRAAAQMVSYEVSIGFVLISVVLYANSFNLSDIVLAQQGNIGFGLLNGFGFNPLLFPMAVVFLISSMAETFRTPFDLVEAESELVAGYQTEYSSMSFALFWLGEYGNVLLMCALNAILFWGGWLPPIDWAPLYWISRASLWLFAKMLFFFFVFGWVKATVPRYRYDQLMRLGWKIFLPLSLAFVVIVSGWLMLTRYGVSRMNPRSWLKAFTLWEFVRAHCADAEIFLQAQGDDQLSVREEPAEPALPRRACAAPLSQRRGALHRLQAVRGDLPGAGDHHRGRGARGRQPPHHPLRHRHGQMHLLRAVPGSLPGRRHRRGAEPRIRDRDAGGAALRQGQIARQRRPLGTSDRRQPCRRRAVSIAAATGSSLDRTPRLLSVRDADHRFGGRGDLRAQPGAQRAVADPGLLQRGGPDAAGRGRVHRHAAGHRLRRRGRGAVPVRGDDARRRFRVAALGLHPQLAVRAAGRAGPAGRDHHRRQRAQRRAAARATIPAATPAQHRRARASCSTAAICSRSRSPG